jgi:hypothetical protein
LIAGLVSFFCYNGFSVKEVSGHEPFKQNFSVPRSVPRRKIKRNSLNYNKILVEILGSSSGTNFLFSDIQYWLKRPRKTVIYWPSYPPMVIAGYRQRENFEGLFGGLSRNIDGLLCGGDMSLTDTEVCQLKFNGVARKVADEKGLYLLVTANGSKLWRLKYRFNGKEKKLSPGQYPDVSLKSARQKRDAARSDIANGIDPSRERKH